jgi:phasin family protein
MQQKELVMPGPFRNTSVHGAVQQKLYLVELTPHHHRRSTMLTAEQMLAAHKANVETLFGLTGKAFEGVEKLVELNLQVAKAAMGEVAETTKAALSVKDAQELMALQAGLLQPAAEKAAAYSRHLYDIAAATNAEVSKVVEATAADSQKKFMAVVDTAVKNAPAGTENAVALVKSAVAAANNAYESVHKAAKQAAEVAEANFQTITSSAVKATQAATKSAKRAA